MFLDGTYHVLLIYIIVGLILCIPPLIMPQWKSLVQSLNKRELSNKKHISIILICLGLAISIISIIFMTLHAYYLLNVVYTSYEVEYIMFNLYTIFSFNLLPLALALIGTASYIKYSSNPKLGNVSILLIALFALGLAGSYLHDVLYCATRTELYTLEVNASYDLVWWLNLLRVESKDYRVFGFYMNVLTIILIIFASILLWRFSSNMKEENCNINKKKILILSILFVIELGIALYVMEYFRIFTFIPEIIATFIGVPFSIFLAYYFGKNLSKS